MTRETPVTSANSEEVRSDSGAYVLLAEDMTITTEIVRAILKEAGHRVDVVSDGAAAIRAVADNDYDLVLMDVQMPELDGIAATQAIRSLAGPRGRVPIVALTARTSDQDRQGFLANGLNSHVDKPFRKAELLAVISPWLGTAAAAS